MYFVRLFTALLARFFLSSIFIFSGASKIIYWHQTEMELMKMLTDWGDILSFSTATQIGFSHLMVWAPLFLICATLLELLGALLLLFGVKEKLGAFLLICFLLPTTFFFHSFWFAEGGARELQMALFLRNLAILGGLMMVTLHGDARQSDPFSLEQME